MGREHLSEENDRQVRTAEALDVPFEGEDAIDAADVIVDAVFGIGLTRPVTGYVLEIIRKINAAKAFVIAADIPSGIAADTGAVLGDAYPRFGRILGESGWRFRCQRTSGGRRGPGPCHHESGRKQRRIRGRRPPPF